MKTVIETLEELFPEHEIECTFNEAGYSDVQLIIDNYCTGIWVDDYNLYLTEQDEDFQLYLDIFKRDIDEYLSYRKK